MAAWQEDLFEAILEGNTSLVSTLLETESIDVNRKVFFSALSYTGYKKTFTYYAQSSAQTSLVTWCSLLGVLYILSGCIFSFSLMALDREFTQAPAWLPSAVFSLFIPIPIIVVYFSRVVLHAARPDATPLHVAAWANQPLVVRLLRLHFNADPTIRDSGKRSVFDVTTNAVVQRELTTQEDPSMLAQLGIQR